MRENLLSIKINKNIYEVFNFTINPENTHKWIDFIDKEWIEWEKIEKWIIYKNSNNWDINTYKLINFEENKIFHLKNINSKYEVIYFYNKINENETILNYYEFMSDWNNLEWLFEQKTLIKLKNILENNK